MDENNFPNIFDESGDSNPQFPLKPKRFEKSRSERVLAGVCAGIAAYFDTDPSGIRLAAILSLLLGGWSVVFYLLLAFLMPDETEPRELTDEEKALQRKINLRTLLGGLMILSGIYFGFSSLGFFSSSRLFIFPDEITFPLIAIGIGFYLWTRFENVMPELPVLPNNFVRSRANRRLLGVCGGLASYTNTDATSIRVLFFIGAALTAGILSVVYLIFAFTTKLEEPHVDQQN